MMGVATLPVSYMIPPLRYPPHPVVTNTERHLRLTLGGEGGGKGVVDFWGKGHGTGLVVRPSRFEVQLCDPGKSLGAPTACNSEH